MRRIPNGVFYRPRTGRAPAAHRPRLGVRALAAARLRAMANGVLLFSAAASRRHPGSAPGPPAHLRELARLHAGRDPTPRAAILARRSVKPLLGGVRGFDGHQKLVGRKRHILVATEGVSLGVVVQSGIRPASLSATAANRSWKRPVDPIRVCSTFGPITATLGRRAAGAPGRWAEQEYGWRVPLVYPAARQMKRYAPDLLADLGDAPGVGGIPRRWVVARTFSWLGRQRRRSPDYERLPRTEEAFIYLVGIRLLLTRLAPA
jgi:putative transposase